ncbi:DUF1656 domain-containing protein [Aeromonas dhakensis]|uniref:DUF1656 domain-containing protein n=1 Tax=Aeromonas dhakensis TaxID=196024 RepID=UPI003F83C415
MTALISLGNSKTGCNSDLFVSCVYETFLKRLTGYQKMIGEINLDGIYISPLLVCLISAFFLRLVVSRFLDWVGAYQLIAKRPLFDTALFLLLTGVCFYGLRLLTTP